jgi:hypothetical protein
LRIFAAKGIVLVFVLRWVFRGRPLISAFQLSVFQYFSICLLSSHPSSLNFQPLLKLQPKAFHHRIGTGRARHSVRAVAANQGLSSATAAGRGLPALPG